MLHQLAENGRLGIPARRQDDEESTSSASHEQTAEAKGASNLRKARAALSQQAQG